MSYDTSGTYNRTLSNSDSGQNRNPCANPHVVTYSYRLGAHYALVTLTMIKGVNYRIYAYIGADEHVTAYRDLSFVEYCEIIVAYKIRAYGDICSKIAVKRTVDVEGLLNLADKTAHNVMTAVTLPRRQ